MCVHAPQKYLGSASVLDDFFFQLLEIPMVVSLLGCILVLIYPNHIDQSKHWVQESSQDTKVHREIGFTVESMCFSDDSSF